MCIVVTIFIIIWRKSCLPILNASIFLQSSMLYSFVLHHDKKYLKDDPCLTQQDTISMEHFCEVLTSFILCNLYSLHIFLNYMIKFDCILIKVNLHHRTSSMGHCAVLVNSTIYYIGGIDSRGIAIIDIQTYDVENNVWIVIGHREMTRHFYDANSRLSISLDPISSFRGQEAGDLSKHNPCCMLKLYFICFRGSGL
jgi:hypothetical protein